MKQRMLVEAALRPSPRRDLHDPFFCPLGCGFVMANDWDGHFVRCLLTRTVEVWFSDPR